MSDPNPDDFTIWVGFALTEEMTREQASSIAESVVRRGEGLSKVSHAFHVEVTCIDDIQGEDDA